MLAYDSYKLQILVDERGSCGIGFRQGVLDKVLFFPPKDIEGLCSKNVVSTPKSPFHGIVLSSSLVEGASQSLDTTETEMFQLPTHE